MLNGRPGSPRSAISAGFTLIELLVVIAIIAILAAILFPVILNAKAASKAGTCKVNLRQLGMAFREYLDDWNSLAPPAADGYIIWKTRGNYGYATNPVGWTERLWPYHHKMAIYKCPARRVNFGYTYNGNLAQTALEISRSTAPLRPSKLILAFDSPGSGSGYINPRGGNPFSTGNADQTNEGQDTPVFLGRTDTFSDFQWLVPDEGEMGGSGKFLKHSLLYLPGPHNGAINVLLYDSHVKAVSAWTPGELLLIP